MILRQLRTPGALLLQRFSVAIAALAGIVLVYHRWLHVNPTTVALTLLLFILLLAAEWGLRYAVTISVLATGCYNFYFLPPYGTFRIADAQNWLALFAFLATSVVGSRLSDRARDEAKEARTREREVELLFRLSRAMLRTESVSTLVTTLPEVIAKGSGAGSVVLFLLKDDLLCTAGEPSLPSVGIAHLRHLTLTLPGPEEGPEDEMMIPVRTGTQPIGMLILKGLTLSPNSFQAIGGLVSVALTRAAALEDLARGEAAKESERLRTLILDSITHELRTPLTSIKGAATTLLSNQGIAEDDRRELLTIVDEESDRLNRLISQAVEMAELDARQVHMTLAPVAVGELVEVALETCAWIMKSHTVSVDVANELRVMADAELVRKVLCNLLENAAKYSAAGAEIEVSARSDDGVVWVSVADHGMGVAPAEQALIFDRLYRARASAMVSGTGMGLAISRAIVESHDGVLTLESQPGKGSVFTFSLPAA